MWSLCLSLFSSVDPVQVRVGRGWVAVVGGVDGGYTLGLMCVRWWSQTQHSEGEEGVTGGSNSRTV